MTLSYRLELADGTLVPFSRDKLYLSVFECMKHRPEPEEESSALVTTVVSKVLQRKRLIISRQDLVEIAGDTLKRYNLGVSQIYRSLHST